MRRLPSLQAPMSTKFGKYLTDKPNITDKAGCNCAPL